MNFHSDCSPVAKFETNPSVCPSCKSRVYFECNCHSELRLFLSPASKKKVVEYNNRGGDQPQPSTRYFKVIKNYRFCGSSLFEEKGRKERGRRGGKNSTVNWLELIEFFIVAKVPQNFRTNDNRPTISVERGE